MGEDFERVMRHHRATWRVERIGWCVIALLLAATLLGLFGDGPLSRARAGSDETLSVEYDRLLRSSAPTQYRFRASPALAARGSLRLRFDQSLIEHMEVDSIVPQPEHQLSGPGYTEFIFLLNAGRRPATIDLRYRPATFGRQHGRVSVAGEHALVIDQFAYP